MAVWPSKGVADDKKTLSRKSSEKNVGRLLGYHKGSWTYFNTKGLEGSLCSR